MIVCLLFKTSKLYSLFHHPYSMFMFIVILTAKIVIFNENNEELTLFNLENTPS